MKAIRSSETSGSTYPATQCNIPGIPESSAEAAAAAPPPPPPSEPNVLKNRLLLYHVMFVFG